MEQSEELRQSSSQETPALYRKAEDNLAFIRSSMESATAFTGVSGAGYIVAGLSAFAATWIAQQQPTLERWLLVWMLELALAAPLILLLTALKAKQQGSSLWSSNGKKLLLAFAPAMTVGGLLTLNSYLTDDIQRLPGIWLGIYGAAVMTAGAYSVAAIPIMGALFILISAAILVTGIPATLTMGVSFALLHCLFGYLIWRDYGG
ncbi:MAG: hypothetical protein RKH07_00365 [Gammaproteobacteria bacterium]